TGQEMVMYEKESTQQKERIAKLVENGADIHDIRKQQEVLDETTQMLPDCKVRLAKAHRELAEMIASIGTQDADCEEMALATSTLESTLVYLS
ncbi:hypothetical protein HDV03_003005, partial [Kappamyces sp. JEL0829]